VHVDAPVVVEEAGVDRLVQGHGLLRGRVEHADDEVLLVVEVAGGGGGGEGGPVGVVAVELADVGVGVVAEDEAFLVGPVEREGLVGERVVVVEGVAVEEAGLHGVGHCDVAVGARVADELDVEGADVAVWLGLVRFDFGLAQIGED